MKKTKTLMDDEDDEKSELEEVLKKAGSEKFLQERTELGEAFEFLDSDKQDEKGRSAIDLNARLTRDEINAIKIIDEFKNFGILPENVDITRQHKRLSVSIDGQGRREKVEMAQGVRETAQNKGFLGGLFSKREG